MTLRLYALAILLCFVSGCCNHGDIIERSREHLCDLKADLYDYQRRAFPDPYASIADQNYTDHLMRKCREHVDWLEANVK